MTLFQMEGLNSKKKYNKRVNEELVPMATQMALAILEAEKNEGADQPFIFD